MLLTKARENGAVLLVVEPITMCVGIYLLFLQPNIISARFLCEASLNVSYARMGIPMAHARMGRDRKSVV